MASTPDPASSTAHLSIQCVNVFVRNHDRSLRFFVDRLGFHLAYDMKLQSGGRLVAVAPPDGSTVLSLVVPKPKSPECKLIGRSTNVVLITDDVMSKFQEWSKRGVFFHSTPRLKRMKYDAESGSSPRNDSAPILGAESTIWGSVVARFRDVDGNIFSLVSFDEVTHALEAQRRADAARREAERRAAQELEIANEVQCRFFPQLRPAIPGLDYAGRCYSARAVGGDYYDFLELGPDRFGFVIGDVSGKGIAAALLMANLQAHLRGQCSTFLDDPQRLLQSVNLLFSQNTPDGAFATLFYGDFHAPSGRLRYSNCGHLPALLLRADNSLDRLEPTATVLGIFKKWDCEIGECTLRPGDTFALYTDGITEAFDDSRDEFGEARLLDSLRRHRSLPAQSILEGIVADVRSFSSSEQHDDVTLLIAKAC